MTEPERRLHALLDAAIAAGDPATSVPPHLPSPPTGRTVVLGAGKASAAMARAVEDHWPGALSGLVVTRYGYGVECPRIEVVEAAHPVPDAAGRAAAARIIDLARGLGADDLALVLVSGGASALLSLPAPGLTLADKQAVTKALLAAGADITELNTVRKHLSAIKGGRLAAAAWPAQTVALLISDVAGDDPAVIGSGPTVADPTRHADALAVIEKYGVAAPTQVLDRLRGDGDETPKPGEVRLDRAEARIVADPSRAIEAAARAARGMGLEPIILGDTIEGESRAVAAAQAACARAAAGGGRVLLSGGETTVTVRGQGRGGPNTEFALALAIALHGAPGIHAIACDTDGTDGAGDNAGALVGPDTLSRARTLGLDPALYLADNDSYGFFAELDDLVTTGPTRTNVNDFRAILIA